MLKAIVVGCGRIGGAYENNVNVSHGEAYGSSQKITLLAGVDRNFERATRFAQRFGCKSETSIREALRKYQPHVVSVCTPDDTHFEVTVEILSSTCSPRVIFLEKPVCASEDQYVRMQRLGAEQGTLIVVNHTRRFDMTIRTLRDQIFNGQFGSLLRAYAVYYGGWSHNGTHVVDTLLFLLDEQLKIDDIVNAVDSSFQNDPTLEVKGVLQRSKAPVLISAIDEKHYQIFEFDFWFERARLRIEDFGSRVILEHRMVNEIGENVLVTSANNFSKWKKAPILNAVDQIQVYLERGDESLLKGSRLADIAPTMQTIWEGHRLYEYFKSKPI